MPPSAAESPERIPGFGLAVAAEALFLINLMLAPFLGFLVLAALWWRRRDSAPPLARCHLDQTFYVSLAGGVLLVAACLLIVLAGGLDWAWTWVMVVLYFTLIHSTLILLGMLGLARALSGREYVYPVIGRPFRG